MSNWRKLFQTRRLTALFLAVTLTVPTMPVSAYAATDETVVETIAETEGTTQEAGSVTETESALETEEEAGEEASLEENGSVEETTSTEASSETESPYEEESTSSIVESTEPESVSEEETTIEDATTEESTVETTEETVEEEKTEEIIVEEAGFIVKAATESNVVVEDPAGNYQLTVKVTDDTVTQYAEITGFTDLGTSSSYVVTIPATVPYNGINVKIIGILKSSFKGQTAILLSILKKGLN